MGCHDGTADDYSAFIQVWDAPEGGLHGYLTRFLESDDTTFQHIAVWTCVQLLESSDRNLEQLIRSSDSLLPLIKSLAEQHPPAAHGHDEDRSLTGSDEDEGEGEIATLAKKVLDMLDGKAGSQAGDVSATTDDG